MSTNPPEVLFLQQEHRVLQPNQQYAKLLEAYRLDPTSDNLARVQRFAKENGFNYFLPSPPEHIPPTREPAPGIRLIRDFRFHINAKFHMFENMPKLGFAPLGFISGLISTFFLNFLSVLDNYVRPSGSTDAIFENFNQETKPVLPPEPDRLMTIMSLIIFFFAIKPYSPIAFPDLRFYKWTLTTASDYHSNHSQDLKEESKRYWKHLHDNDLLDERFDYSERPRSKGYFFNSVLLASRTIVHNIKYYGWPFKPTENETDEHLMNKLHYWFMKYPTQLFVRSQISPLDKLKVRPVYNAPFLFILIEAMLTLPLMVMCRLPASCIMWGYETVRGGMQELNRIAYSYSTYIMIDWSRFDQLMPFTVIYHFWCTFLPMLIRVDRGWMPTSIYKSESHAYAYTEKDPQQTASSPKYAKFAQPLRSFYKPHVIMFSFIIFNLIAFIWLWYVKMVFVTPDGYGYVRLLAGVPSGIFMTQILDSFCNVFLFVDGLIEFGFTPDEIRTIRLFIQGDDNVAFFKLDFERVFAFYEWFPQYALARWNMIVSVDKSSITRLRSRIEVLGYRNANGMPYRNREKLVATLAMPERLPRMSKPADYTKLYIILMSRAIGIALASAGHDYDVYDLCRRSYNDARAKSGLTSTELRSIPIEYRKLGFMEMQSLDMIEIESHLPQDLSRFPDYYDIRANLYNWHGPHTVYPTWPAQFTDDLSEIQSPDDVITLYDVMQRNGYKFDMNH